MTPVLIGQILGVAFASGLNIYATVAALGLLSRIGLIQELPPALHGLQSAVVIGSALALYLVEAIIDRVHHADSLWDTIHTFVRPPAAALLALGILWGHPLEIQLAGAAFALFVALAAHGTKAGFRVAVNAGTDQRSTSWISTAEDLAAVLFVVAAFEYPGTALAAGAAVLVLIAVFGPSMWRAFALGLRCVAAWIRALFVSPGWREADALPARLRALLRETPLGAAQPRVTRAAVKGLPGVGAFRNGWLVVADDGAAFLSDGLLGARRTEIPVPLTSHVEPGLWVHTLQVHHEGGDLAIYLLRDGPAAELTLSQLHAMIP
jgi:hypothetical protein